MRVLVRQGKDCGNFKKNTYYIKEYKVLRKQINWDV